MFDGLLFGISVAYVHAFAGLFSIANRRLASLSLSGHLRSIVDFVTQVKAMKIVGYDMSV